MEKRDWKIYYEWIDGKDYKDLAKEFNLAISTIKEICTSKIPPKIRQTPWQTANQYAKWRQYLHSQRVKQRAGLSTPDTSTGRSSAE